MLLRVHIIATSAWLGLIAAETVMELMAKDKSTRLFVAKAHCTSSAHMGPLALNSKRHFSAHCCSSLSC